MAINKDHGGVQKPINKSIGILYFGDTTGTDAVASISTIDADSNLDSMPKLYNCTVSTDGIQVTHDVTEPELLTDFNGNTIDQTDPSTQKSITFKVLEVLSSSVARLMHNDSAITDASGVWSEIVPGTTPKNKVLILVTRIKGKKVMQVFEDCAFAGASDQEVTSDGLTGWDITYNVITEGKSFTKTIP